MGSIQNMLNAQRALQLRYNNGVDFADLPSEQLMAKIRENALALIAELAGEALDETGWKPWASSNHINKPEYNGELIDIWHFFMNLMLIGGMTEEHLVNGYFEKNRRNHERLDKGAGYDGISGKCPICRRDLGDVDAHASENDRMWYYLDIRYCGIDCWNAARVAHGENSASLELPAIERHMRPIRETRQIGGELAQ